MSKINNGGLGQYAKCKAFNEIGVERVKLAMASILTALSGNTLLIATFSSFVGFAKKIRKLVINNYILLRKIDYTQRRGQVRNQLPLCIINWRLITRSG